MRHGLAFLLAALSGASMALQGACNAVLGKKIGPFQAAFLVHVIATLLLGLIVFAARPNGDFRQVSQSPWYSFLGGPLNVLIIWGVLSSIAQLGVAPATTAVLFTQIGTALVLDVLGVTGSRVAFTLTKALGAVLFGLGAWLLLKK